MKAFVDVGAFRGSTIRRFKLGPRYSPDWKIYAFECNPKLADFRYDAGVDVIRKAAWIDDGELQFFISRKSPALVQGSSVYREKTTGNLDTDHPVTTPCIDFSAWLSLTFQPGDTVIVKMNIEGAEYDVLEKCVADGTISLVSELYIQWHNSKCNIPRARHDALKKALSAVPGLKMFPGYGHLGR